MHICKLRGRKDKSLASQKYEDLYMMRSPIHVDELCTVWRNTS